MFKKHLKCALVINLLAALSIAVANADSRVDYSFIGTVTAVSNNAGILPAGVHIGTPFDLQMIVDSSFPGSGNSVLANYGETNPNGPFPIQWISLTLGTSAPIKVFGVPSVDTPSLAINNHVTLEENFYTGSYVDELVAAMAGLQSDGNLASFGVDAIAQTASPSGFITSLALGAPLGHTPASAINAFTGNMPISVSFCTDATCSGGLPGVSVVTADLTAVGVPEPAPIGLMGLSLALLALSRRGRGSVQKAVCRT